MITQLIEKSYEYILSVMKFLMNTPYKKRDPDPEICYLHIVKHMAYGIQSMKKVNVSI